MSVPVEAEAEDADLDPERAKEAAEVNFSTRVLF